MGIGKLRFVLSLTLLMCLGVVRLTWADPAREADADGMRLRPAGQAQAYLDLKGGRENQAQYMVLVGYVGNQLAQHDAEARQLLEEAKTKCDTAVWPYPIIRYLRHEITADALLAAATDADKQTEAQ